MSKKAIVLLSGGVDSATTLYLAKKRGFECHCLIFDYNQRHKKELECARRIAETAKCEYEIMKINFPWNASSLLNKDAQIPKGRFREGMNKDIPSTYVPARNTIFVSLAAGWAEAIGADRVFIGANAVDYSGYPDCRPGYLDTFNRLLKEGTKRGVSGESFKVEAPLIDKSKSEIITMGMRMKVPYELTWSCYEGGEYPCMKCDSCMIRAKGFRRAGADDPILKVGYATA
ncbi:MAG: 7-cyano-7-deazaguanine synthase QueC [Candidatus Omnitrophica bacterium]|nr:7-cyano-7-deazaguanine synthase QueC [Candidatus Omnitrophota bacterium]